VTGDAGDDVWELARAVCTPLELEALRLNEQMGYKRMAAHLGLSISTVRGRVDRATAKIMRERASRRRGG
jgi:predicted DNA-binding protein (UPF0251 family)